MKPQMQLRVSNVNGDCHAACIASILDVPIETLPDFFSDNPPNPYTRRTEWLLNHGLQESYYLVGSFPAPYGYGILSVRSAVFPGATHSVVWDGEGTGWGKIIHNPNPEDPRGVEIPNKDWVGFWVLALLDPARVGERSDGK